MKKAVFLGVLWLLFGWPMQSYASTPSSVTLFAGQSNYNNLVDLIRFRLGYFEPYSVIGMNYNKVLFRTFTYANLELAGTVVKHLEQLSLFEFDALLIFRWKWFPWNRVISTSLGLGEGWSYATGYPSSETVSQNIYSKHLNHLWVDLRLAFPSRPEWSLDFMIHHRSGAWGFINGVSGGSNYLCIGITRSL